MLIENAAGLFLLRSVELAQVGRAAVGEAVGGGVFIVMPAVGPLPRLSKIDHVSHSRPVW